MAAPEISPLPPAPLPNDSKTTFNAKAFPFVAALDVFRQEINAFGAYIGDEVDIVKTIRAPEDLAALPNTEGRASRILGFSAGGDPTPLSYGTVRGLINVEDGAQKNLTPSETLTAVANVSGDNITEKAKAKNLVLNGISSDPGAVKGALGFDSLLRGTGSIAEIPTIAFRQSRYAWYDAEGNPQAKTYQQVLADVGSVAGQDPSTGSNARLIVRAGIANNKTQIQGDLNVEDGATANETDEFLLNRSNHDGTQLASTISDFVESVQENATIDVQGMELSDIAYIEVDDLLRPVRFLKTDGRYYQAVDGRLSNLFGGPDSGRAVPLIQDWAELTVDAEGRPVSGMKTDGTRYTAVDGRLVSEDASAKSSMPSTFAAYGDSTTYGDDLDDEKGAGWEAYRWTTLLSESLGVQVDNRGVNGQRAEQIAVRSGGLCATAKPTGGKIPATGGVVLTDFNPGSFPGANGFATLVDLMVDDGNAIRGNIVSTSTGNVMTFTRLKSGVEVDVDVVDIIPVQGRKDLQNHFILGAGINNESRIVSGEQTIEQIKSWYSAMTSRANNGFTVWGVLDRGLGEAAGTVIGDYIRALEAWLRVTYGDNFCDVRGYLSSQRALDDAVMLEPSYTPTTNDNNAVAGNTVPPSFRSSGGSVHLNSRGHALQARFMARYFRRRFSNYIYS